MGERESTEGSGSIWIKQYGPFGEFLKRPIARMEWKVERTSINKETNVTGSSKCRACLGICLLETQQELIALALTTRATVGVHHRLKQLGSLGLILFRQGIEHVHNLVIPAALPGPAGMQLAQRRPDPQVPVGNRKARKLQALLLQIAQQLAPRSLLSRSPASQATNTFSPPAVAPTMTRSAALRSEMPALDSNRKVTPPSYLHTFRSYLEEGASHAHSKVYCVNPTVGSG